MDSWKEYELGELLSYEQPALYIVESTQYDNCYKTPVLTAGKTFIIGYTNEETGVYDTLPVIIFDDFTTSIQYVDFPFKVKSSAMKILTANTELVLPKFIYYRMQIIEFDHSTHKRYWIQEYSKIKVSIPSLSKQEHIVAWIDELFSELDNTEETLKKVKQQIIMYRQAVYVSVYDKFTEMKPITDYFDISGGLTKNSNRNNYPLKMPYLRVANVYFNQLELAEVKTIGVTENEITKTALQKDDLLFVEGNGSKEQIGRVAIWDGSIENCLHQNHLIKGRSLGGMLPKYALYYLISGYGRRQILDVASSTSGLYTLSTNKIKSLQVPICSLQQQKQCVSDIEMRISVCNRVEEIIDTTLQKAEATRQSILKQAFEEEFHGN